MVEGDERFPISKMGSGLKTILLVLLNLIVCSKEKGTNIFLFEELENNLHPALQRRLFNYIHNYAIKNNALFFITSHSHVAVNCFYSKENTSIYHIEKKKGISTISSVNNTFEYSKLLDDLDVKASDLLQSNGIIWVEGPSDRIYIKKWISLVDDSLEENVHFQFAYYGGRLLSHYTANDENEDQNLIRVLLTNRNSAIVIDSDRRKKTDTINSTKERIRNEFVSKKLFVWITDGNEFDFDNTAIDSDTNVYASYEAWSGVIADSNTLDLSLMTKGYEVFGDSTSTDARALTGTIYSLLKGNTCYATTSTNVGDFGKSTAAIKTAGGLNNHKNGVSFTVSNPGTLTVWVKNGSSGNRTFGLYKDGDTSTAEDTATASSLAECTLNISAVGTYELGSTDGSVYFYYISFEAAPEVTVSAFQQEAEGDTTAGNETTFVRFIAIVSGVADINSSDFTFKIYRTNDVTTQSITRTVGTYKALTVKGVAYSATLPGESSAHTFDGNNNTEFYAVYVVELTNATYSGYNVYAEFTYGGEKYTTSGYTFE